MSERDHDIRIIRELAKRYMEIALSDRHVRMRKRFLDTNDLKRVRPPVLIDEIPWEQMNIDHALDCSCEDGELRGIEYALRICLFREKYLKCDNFIEPFWVVKKSYASTGNGLDMKERVIRVENSSIASHEFEDVLADEAALKKYHDPVITAYPEKDAAKVAHMQEIFGDTLPIVLQGHGISFGPWDRIVRFRGVEPILFDMYDRPEYLHRIVALFTREMKVEMDQMEALHLYDPNRIALHCTPGYVTVKDPSPEGEYGCRDMWFRTMAQLFSSVSPAAHDEFDIQYTIPLASRCAYTYYGCCEPLHDRIDILKKIPNLRKIGVSPWADVARSAEQIGGDYVLARKPNPANVAFVTDPAVVKKEIVETVELCRRYGCPFDYVLKDISTVGDRPENLILWANTVSDVLDGYYGEA